VRETAIRIWLVWKGPIKALSHGTSSKGYRLSARIAGVTSLLTSAATAQLLEPRYL